MKLGDDFCGLVTALLRSLSCCGRGARSMRRATVLFPICIAVGLLATFWLHFKRFHSFFRDPPPPFSFPNGKRMAYVSSWDDAGNVVSMHVIAQLQAQEGIKFPLTVNAQTTAFTNAIGLCLNFSACCAVGPATA